jgi:hypothetical protein
MSNLFQQLISSVQLSVYTSSMTNRLWDKIQKINLLIKHVKKYYFLLSLFFVMKDSYKEYIRNKTLFS